MNHIIISWNMFFFPLCFTFEESTFLSWRSSQLSISMSLGKPHAASSRRQAALLVRTTHSRWYSTRSSARRTFRGWRWLMPRDPQSPTSHQAKSKVVWKTLSLINKFKSYKKILLQQYFFLYFFLPGVKRKSASVIDMLKKKERKT